MRILLQAFTDYLARTARGFVAGWGRFWFAPCDPVSLAPVRIGLGLLLLLSYGEMIGQVGDYVGPRAWIDDGAMNALRDRAQPIPGVDWYGFSLWFLIRDPGQIAIFHGYFLGAILCFTLGFFSRAATVAVWLVHLSYVHRGHLHWFGMDAVASMLLFCLIWGPTGGAWSVDGWLRRRWPALGSAEKASAPSWTANLALRLIQIHMCVIYICAGLSKLQGEHWWDGSAVWQIMMNDHIAPFDWRWVANLGDRGVSLVSSLGVLFTLGFEIAFPFLIWNPTARPILLAAALFLHGAIGLVMGLTGFSLVMLAGCGAFIRPESWRWFAAALRSRPAPGPTAT